MYCNELSPQWTIVPSLVSHFSPDLEEKKRTSFMPQCLRFPNILPSRTLSSIIHFPFSHLQYTEARFSPINYPHFSPPLFAFTPPQSHSGVFHLKHAPTARLLLALLLCHLPTCLLPSLSAISTLLRSCTPHRPLSANSPHSTRLHRTS